MSPWSTKLPRMPARRFRDTWKRSRSWCAKFIDPQKSNARWFGVSRSQAPLGNERRIPPIACITFVRTDSLDTRLGVSRESPSRARLLTRAHICLYLRLLPFTSITSAQSGASHVFLTRTSLSPYRIFGGGPGEFLPIRASAWPVPTPRPPSRRNVSRLNGHATTTASTDAVAAAVDATARLAAAKLATQATRPRGPRTLRGRHPGRESGPQVRPGRIPLGGRSGGRSAKSALAGRIDPTADGFQRPRPPSSAAGVSRTQHHGSPRQECGTHFERETGGLRAGAPGGSGRPEDSGSQVADLVGKSGVRPNGRESHHRQERRPRRDTQEGHAGG